MHELTSEFSQTEYYCWNIEIPETINYLEFNYVSEIINKAHYVPYIYLSQDDKQQRELLEIINSAGQIYENKTHTLN